MRGVGKIFDFKSVRLSKTGRAVWRPLANVKETSLPGWVSLDLVRTVLSNIHRCCAFPFALAGLLLLKFVNNLIID